MSHGVLPSQIRTRLSCLSALSSNTLGGGANGQPRARVIGNSGISVAVEPSVIVLLLVGPGGRVWWLAAGRAHVDRRAPEADDRVDQPFAGDRPCRARPRSVFGQRAFVFRAGVHEQV